MPKKILLMCVFAVVAVTSALQAQEAGAETQAAAEPAAPLPDVTSGLGLFVYPANQQDAHQQSMDELECYAWAQEQSGVNPMNIDANAEAAAAAARQQTADATTGAAVGGAARGAVAGVAIGAIAGDAGKGAAIGAVAGGVRGRRAKKMAEAQAAQAGAAQAEAGADAQLDTFKRAMSVCLEGRGYTVQ
jgi:hypothetical protein